MITKKQLTKYYRKIEYRMKCSKKQKLDCINDFKSQLEEYIMTEPASTIESIYEVFGCPKFVAQNYMDQLGEEEMKNYKVKIMVLKTGMFTSMVMCLVVLVALICVIIAENLETGYIVVGEVRVVSTSICTSEENASNCNDSY